jgi:hypothetical protein
MAYIYPEKNKELLLQKLSLLFITLLLMACDQNSVNIELFVAKSPVASISIRENADKQLHLRCEAVWFSTCGDYHHFDMVEEDTTFLITVYLSQPENRFCSEEFSQEICDFTLSFETGGKKNLRFWVNDNTTRDTTVVVAE